ncbi:hypothetical protein V2J09_024251, partial [Rumex salicifolius]
YKQLRKPTQRFNSILHHVVSPIPLSHSVAITPNLTQIPRRQEHSSLLSRKINEGGVAGKRTRRTEEMGVRFREPTDSASVSLASTATTSPSLREVLLFTTMSIIGLTVEVHIKDGSVYSGIFHTASVDKGYGVVLKKARMIKKGTHASNELNRSLIDTLVVLPENLVQVLAKSVIISPDGVCDGVGCDNVGAVTSDSKSCGSPEKVASCAKSQLDEQTNISVRHDGVRRTQEEGASNAKPCSGYQKEEPVHEVQAIMEGCKVPVKSRKENDKVVTKQLPNGTSGTIVSQTTRDGSCQPEIDSNAVKTVASIMSDKTSSSSTTTIPVAPVQNSVANISSKESKLNPGAKKFSPSFTSVRSVAASPVLPGGANAAYVPNHFPTVPLVQPQSESGIRSFTPNPSLPLKLVSYGNMATLNGGTSGLQYTQPIAGPILNRPHPIKYSNQYQSFQPGPVYAQPVHQNGLIGRAGQLVYLNPATHEMVPAPLSFSHVAHPQLTSHSVHFSKHEGVIAAPPPQLSFTPLMVNEQLPFAVPSPIPFPQPAFPSIRPVPELGPSGPYSVKYH